VAGARGQYRDLRHYRPRGPCDRFLSYFRAGRHPGPDPCPFGTNALHPFRGCLRVALHLFLCLYFGLNPYMHYFSALLLNIPYNILMHPRK